MGGASSRSALFLIADISTLLQAGTPATPLPPPLLGKTRKEKPPGQRAGGGLRPCGTTVRALLRAGKLGPTLLAASQRGAAVAHPSAHAGKWPRGGRRKMRCGAGAYEYVRLYAAVPLGVHAPGGEIGL